MIGLIQAIQIIGINERSRYRRRSQETLAKAYILKHSSGTVEELPSRCSGVVVDTNKNYVRLPYASFGHT